MTETTEQTNERRARVIKQQRGQFPRHSHLAIAKAIAESDKKAGMVLACEDEVEYVPVPYTPKGYMLAPVEPRTNFKVVMDFCAENNIILTRERHLIKLYHETIIAAAQEEEEEDGICKHGEMGGDCIDCSPEKFK